ncbi:hypothetical protein [Scytonema sp. PCC 10023]|uniref:hypothetical protein n=1 Tax=Scytonema sp. PCC 10023 TaxID=1680591 RepID=UPI0039C67D62
MPLKIACPDTKSICFLLRLDKSKVVLPNKRKANAPFATVAISDVKETPLAATIAPAVALRVEVNSEDFTLLANSPPRQIDSQCEGKSSHTHQDPTPEGWYIPSPMKE